MFLFYIYSMLKIDWYLEHPLDFEYKNYILLDYILSIDKSYQLHQLSPYLLWTENLINELGLKERVRQIKEKCLRKLKTHSYKKILKEYM